VATTLRLVVGFKLTHYLAFDKEHIMNYVPSMFRKRGCIMFRAVVEEAAALASITLFVGMIVVWAQVLAVL
jgi:hypothetical protein